MEGQGRERWKGRAAVTVGMRDTRDAKGSTVLLSMNITDDRDGKGPRHIL